MDNSITASFSYINGSTSGPTTFFTETDSIFNDEDFTRAQFMSIATVPVPSAAWLFFSGIIGLIGFAKRK